MHGLLLIAVLLSQTPTARPATGNTIAGRLSFSDGTPAAGLVTIWVRIPEAGQRPASLVFPFRTDPTGAFRFTNLAPGRYYVRVGSDGEGFIYYPGVAGESEATVITVAPDVANPDLNFVLPPSASGVRVSGRVTIPANQVAAASSQRVQLDGNAGRLSAPIGADGMFEFLHVRPGRYTIVISPAPGMQPRPVMVSNEEIRDLALVVPRLTGIAGTVSSDAGATRPRFTIATESIRYRTNMNVGPDGSFTTQLPDGEYLLRLNGLPAGYYLRSLASGKTDLIATRLKIGASDAVVPINVSLGTSKGVSVGGRVRVAGGDTSATLVKSILLSGRAVNQSVDALLDENGSFQFENVMPGMYMARVIMASNLGAPPVPVTIPEKNIADLEVVIPPEVEVNGRVAVDGYGPSPKFSLTLSPDSAPATDGYSLNVSALPDGSFKTKLPEGEYRVTVGTGTNAIPAGYILRSLTYGPADLLKEPMHVSPATASEMQIGFSTTDPNPWVKVTGRVIGAEAAKGPFRVALEGRTTATMESLVAQDGTFEFPRVLQRSSYIARLIPANDSASAPAVAVADKDVTGVEIVVPAEKEIRITTSVEDGGPVPGFVMTFAGSGSTMTVAVKPERDGSFRAKLPADERRVRVSGLPLGYVVKSVAFGTADLLKQPLKISDEQTDLRVAFAIDPAIPLGNLRGRVTGVNAERGGVRLVLNGVTTFTTLETPVNPDGSFSISRIPQGTYVPTLAGAVVSGLMSPSTVVISSADVFSVELIAARQTGFNRLPVNDASMGATVTNLGGTPESASEASAVSNLRTINTALVTYLSSNRGNYGNLADLVKAGLLDSRFNGTINGFNFSIIAIGKEYAAAAIPASAGAARYGFYSMPDAVVRYSTVDFLAPQRRGGTPVQ